jgi:hypothetical protein
MTLSDEELMAYVDGELDAPARAAVESRLAADPDACGRLAAQLRLQVALRQRFDPVLDERVPRPLLEAARAPGTALRAVPAQRWYALAASVLLGVVVALVVSIGPRTRAAYVVDGHGMRAGRELAQALSSQLSASATPGDVAEVSLSFVARDGRYCRAYTMGTDAGVACREGEAWRIRAFERLQRPAAEPGGYRQAASALPAGVLIAAQGLMDGDPLDAEAEVAARDHGWKPRTP